jgi:alkylglycerol monooxygenase
MTELTITEVYAIGLPIILAMILVETVISGFNKKSLYKNKDTLCTSGLLLGNILMGFAIKGATLGLHIFLYQFRIFDLVNIIPLWAMWLMTFILIDFVFYIYHRFSHRVRLLWAIHMSHHSSEEMNFAVSMRQAWLGPISKIPFFIVLPLLGLDPTIIAVAGVISTLWGVVGHTQIVGKLGPLEWILNTPSHHRVHHGANAEYIDKNYGNLLIIWDRMFGTFEPEKAKVKYGLVNNVNTFNPIKITFMGWQSMMLDIKKAKNYKEVFSTIFGPPNTRNRSGSF